MPLFPALYRPQKKWRLAVQANALDYFEEDAGLGSTGRRNFASVAELSQKVLAVLEGQTICGQLIGPRGREAKERYSQVVFASLGAIRKEVSDASFSMAPTCSRLIREYLPTSNVPCENAQQDENTFAFSADVSEAHRQTPMHPRDWQGEDLYINAVGTFGAASASYCWSRVASALSRLSHYFSGAEAITWHEVVVDDYLLEAGVPRCRFALMALFMLCSISGEGISQRRADWFVKWSLEVPAPASRSRSRVFMFVVMTLELERPFPGPTLQNSLPSSQKLRQKNAAVCLIHTFDIWLTIERRRGTTTARFLWSSQSPKSPRFDALATSSHPMSWQQCSYRCLLFTLVFVGDH